MKRDALLFTCDQCQKEATVTGPDLREIGMIPAGWQTIQVSHEPPAQLCSRPCATRWMSHYLDNLYGYETPENA